MNSSYKDDFFEGQVYQRKGRNSEYPKQRFLPFLKIPVEYVVILAVGILILGIISYAVGVEVGKRSMGVVPEVEVRSTKDLLNELDIAMDEDSTSDFLEMKDSEEEPVDKNIDVAEDTSSKIEETIATASKTDYNYTIQLASFRNRDSALIEIGKLAKKDVKTEVSKSGDWYQVYAVGYKTIDEAKEAKAILIEKYEDCFIRRIQ